MVLGMVTTAQRVLAGLARVKERGISLGLRPLEDSDAARVDPVGRSRRSLAPASFRRDLTTQPPATIFRTSSAVFGVTETDKLLNRRELCLGALPAVGTITAALSSTSALAAGAVSVSAGRTVKIHDNTIVPALGQGSARLGQGRHPEAAEEEALRTGLSLGMTLIDTAEIYGNGNAERLISHVIAGQRDRVFLVSKVWPSHVAGNGIERACDASLARLGTDHLDLYLLHWPSGITEFSGVVTAFENLVSAGKIRAWGVSNFKVSHMEQLFHVPHGDRCATNQILYNLGDRGIERDLLPWCEQHDMPLMAYSPLGGPDAGLLRDLALARIGAARGCSAAAVALAWTIRNGKVIAIPESGSAAHVKENAVALALTLTPEELEALDAAHPPLGR